MIEWIKLWWAYLKHPNPCCRMTNNERETFVVGRLAFVKCLGCGAESMPWEVSKEKADNWRESHPNWCERLKEVNQLVKKSKDMLR